jgi:hypothetical protein
MCATCKKAAWMGEPDRFNEGGYQQKKGRYSLYSIFYAKLDMLIIILFY